MHGIPVPYSPRWNVPCTSLCKQLVLTSNCIKLLTSNKKIILVIKIRYIFFRGGGIVAMECYAVWRSDYRCGRVYAGNYCFFNLKFRNNSTDVSYLSNWKLIYRSYNNTLEYCMCLPDISYFIVNWAEQHLPPQASWDRLFISWAVEKAIQSPIFAQFITRSCPSGRRNDYKLFLLQEKDFRFIYHL